MLIDCEKAINTNFMVSIEHQSLDALDVQPSISKLTKPNTFEGDALVQFSKRV